MSERKGTGGLRFGSGKPKVKSKPRVTSMTVGRTFNDGNYESTRMDITFDIFPEDDTRIVCDSMLDEISIQRENQLKGMKK